MNKLLSTILFYSLSIIAVGQVSNLQTLQGKVIKVSETTSGIDGNPYILSGKFTEGYVMYKSNTLKGVFMRYNSMTDKIEVEQDENILELNPGGIVRVGFDRQRPGVFSIEMIRLNGRWRQILSQGLIYKTVSARIVQNAQPGFNTAEIETRFVKQKAYFIAKKDGLVSFELKKKSVQNVFDHKNESMAYVKENKLKFNRETDILRMIEFDNSL